MGCCPIEMGDGVGYEVGYRVGYRTGNLSLNMFKFKQQKHDISF